MKQIIDTAFALFFLITLMPFMLFFALMIKLTSRGRVFYTQTRLGKYRKPFTILKFRTMKKEAAFDVDAPVIGDKDANVTWFGKILRRTKMDELPQLINILKGDMSFIGPRPFVADYLPRYEKWEMVKFDVKPGLTGWAQVHGNGYLPLKSRSYYDIEYVKRISLIMDIRIIVKSLLVIVFGEKRFVKPVTPRQINVYKYWTYGLLPSGDRIPLTVRR